MSWSSHISRSISTPNKSSRGGRAVVEFVIHHNASMGGSYVLSLMQSGSKQVSANYQIMQDGEAVGVVPREERSWSVSNAEWDGSAITFEIANNAGAPAWTISNGAYDKVARIIAEDAAHFGIPINRTTVRGHREGSGLGHGGSYSTACPGGINLDFLVQLAQSYAGSSTAGAGSTPIVNVREAEGDDMLHYLCVQNSGNGLIGSGQRFVQGADGVLRCLSDGEWSVIEYQNPNVKPAQWSGDQLMELIVRVGLREYLSGKQYKGGVGPLTGRIIYGAEESKRSFPKVDSH